MKLKKLITTGWKGNPGTVEYDISPVMLLVGPNGTGKTSFIEALRFVLTGETPEGDYINKNVETAFVELLFTDNNGAAFTVRRLVDRTKPSKFYVNGKSNTKKAFDTVIETAMGAPLEKVKVAINQWKIAEMDAKEMKGNAKVISKDVKKP